MPKALFILAIFTGFCAFTIPLRQNFQLGSILLLSQSNRRWLKYRKYKRDLTV